MKSTTFKSTVVTIMLFAALTFYFVEVRGQNSVSDPKEKKGQNKSAQVKSSDNGAFNGGTGNINQAGSTAQVKHDRTGSLNPGPGWKKGDIKKTQKANVKKQPQ